MRLIWIFLLAIWTACAPFRQIPATNPPEGLPAVSYRCEKKQQIDVVYDNSGIMSVAYVRVVGQSAFVKMDHARSASGARYANAQLVWWTKGDEGFLQANQPDGEGQMLIRGCQAVRSANDEE